MLAIGQKDLPPAGERHACGDPCERRVQHNLARVASVCLQNNKPPAGHQQGAYVLRQESACYFTSIIFFELMKGELPSVGRASMR